MYHDNHKILYQDISYITIIVASLNLIDIAIYNYDTHCSLQTTSIF